MTEPDDQTHTESEAKEELKHTSPAQQPHLAGPEH